MKYKYIKNNFNEDTEQKIKTLKRQGWTLYNRGEKIKFIKEYIEHIQG